jgi:catechol 2,3-dioxygenase-like lactoylglutathione lyase family enzyme
MATIRYLVTDVERAIAFYTHSLGFRLDQQWELCSRMGENG